jgi:hypothetical protein
VKDEEALQELAKLATVGADPERAPEIRMPIGGLVYLRFLDEDGVSWMRYRFIGEQDLSMTVGDLTRIAHSYIRDRDEGEDVEDEG